MRFGTSSETVYTYEDGFLTRHGSKSPGIDFDRVPDDAPHRVLNAGPIEVGESASFVLEQGIWRVTTPVTWIEGTDD